MLLAVECRVSDELACAISIKGDRRRGRTIRERINAAQESTTAANAAEASRTASSWIGSGWISSSRPAASPTATRKPAAKGTAAHRLCALARDRGRPRDCCRGSLRVAHPVFAFLARELAVALSPLIVRYPHAGQRWTRIRSGRIRRDRGR